MLDRKKLQREDLKLSEICKERLFETPYFGIIVADIKGEIICCNKKMLALSGFDADQMNGGFLMELVHEDYREDLYANCKHMPGQTRNKPDVFLKMKRADSTFFEVIASISNINDENGSLAGHAVFVSKYTGESLNRSYVTEDGKVRWVDIKDKDQKEEFLCNIFHGIQDSILIMSINGDIVSYNIKCLELLDIDITEMINIGSFKNISADDMNYSVAERFLKDAYNDKEQSFTWQFKKPSGGDVIDVEIYLAKINKMGEDVILATIRDITDKKRIEDALKNSEKRYRQLVEHSPDGIVIHRDGVIKYVNPAGSILLGGSKEEEILGREVVDFFPEADRETIRKRLKQLYEHKQSIPLMEGQMVRIEGTVIDVEFAAMPFELEGKTAVQVVIRDVTEKKKQDAYIRYLALHDTLTGLPNRDLLADRVSKAASRRNRDELKNAVIYLDLDGFKPINDKMGHDAGDEALREIARRLENSVRGSDTAARIGGDEFVILLEGVVGREEISHIADRVLKSINEVIRIEGKDFLVGASMGVSIFPDDSDSHADLMSFADKAMYYVKETGKNRYAFYCDIPENS